MTTEQTETTMAVESAPETTMSVDTSTMPTVQPSFSRELVYAPDGKRWIDKYNGLKGRLMQVEAESAESTGKLEAQLDSLRQRLQETAASAESYKTEAEKISELQEKIDALGEEKKALSTKADRVDQYEVLFRYPHILDKQVEKEIPDPDDPEKTMKVKVNPLLNLVESTTLTGEALEEQVQMIAAMFSNEQSVEAAPKKRSPTDAAIPSPGEPVSSEADIIQGEIDKLNRQMRQSGTMSPGMWQQQQELYDKLRQLEADKE